MIFCLGLFNLFVTPKSHKCFAFDILWLGGSPKSEAKARAAEVETLKHSTCS